MHIYNQHILYVNNLLSYILNIIVILLIFDSISNLNNTLYLNYINIQKKEEFGTSSKASKQAKQKIQDSHSRTEIRNKRIKKSQQSWKDKSSQVQMKTGLS